MLFTKMCGFCGAEFQTPNVRRIFCGPRCRRDADNARERRRRVDWAGEREASVGMVRDPWEFIVMDGNDDVYGNALVDPFPEGADKEVSVIYSKDFQDKLCDEYAAGSLPIKAVAEAHGIGRTTLQSWLFKRGISKKKEGKMGTAKKKPQTVTSSSDAKPGNSKACGLYRDAYQRLQTAFQAYMEAGSLFEAARSAERVFK